MCIYYSIADDMARNTWKDLNIIFEKSSDGTASLDKKVVCQEGAVGLGAWPVIA